MMKKVIAICGFPKQELYDEYKKLPYFPRYERIFEQYAYLDKVQMRKMKNEIHPIALDLMAKLLNLNSADRPNCE